ncbi:MAG TPA: NusG domain II-containing protein [Candidatus Faecivivens stercoripullorum]|uniref:NusG domain II-containing protein n=1 Tax=Candidatus Faecivivens stercoripullorum TaxID=2840805 RepID=A0A9D1H744_9FIRM|nr:NusG domain II-containing protein [Candidatus Faecivivens stercoripullorum]
MEKKKTFGRRDLILLLVVLAIGLAGILFLYTRPAAADGEVEVSVDGEVVMTLPLSEDTEVTISGFDGGENLLVISDGKAEIESASCPDGVCVRHYAISRDGESIICLPNRVVVTIRGGEKGEVDAIA